MQELFLQSRYVVHCRISINVQQQKKLKFKNLRNCPPPLKIVTISNVLNIFKITPQHTTKKNILE